LKKENLTFNDLLRIITSKLNGLEKDNKEKEMDKIRKDLSQLITQNETLTKDNQELLNNFSNLKDALINQKSLMDILLEENKSNKSLFVMLLEENQKIKAISKKLFEENKFLYMQIKKLNNENKIIIKSISGVPEFQNKSKIILNV
jgi:septal ring factor EnvC (AmiA/AmiB activator)